MLHPRTTPLQDILSYVMSLQEFGLSFYSVKVYLTAISAHHGFIEGISVFSVKIMKSFLKTMLKIHPPPAPEWSMFIILSKLMGQPFDPMATTALQLLF